MWNVIPWRDPLLRAADGSDDPIVVASALQFSPMWSYSDNGHRARLHYLSDLPYARLQSSPIPEYSLAIERSITPMQMDRYESFLAKHQRFYLYCYGEPIDEFIVPRLEREGWHLKTLGSELQPLKTYQKKQEYRQIFEVSR